MLAVIAVAGVLYYVQNVKKEAYGDVQLVKVYKVTKPIPQGQQGELTIEQNYVEKGDIPNEYRPGSAITNIDDIKGKVAINSLSPGQVIVDGQFVSPDKATVTFAEQVPNDQVAISLSVDKVHGVAGLLLPGDKVNMLVVGKDGENVTVQSLYQNVNILAIGAKTADSATAANENSEQQALADSGLITVTVPYDAAQRIALVQSAPEKVNFYLTLARPDSQVKDAPANVNVGSLFNTGQSPYPVG